MVVPRALMGIDLENSVLVPERAVGTDLGGLNRFDEAKGTFEHYRHDPADPDSSAMDTVVAIHKDATGTLWIGTGQGFYRFDRQTGRFDRLPHNPPDPGDVQVNAIVSIYEDRAGVMGGVMRDLGNLYRLASVAPFNASARRCCV